jgi:hypothetical protein
MEEATVYLNVTRCQVRPGADLRGVMQRSLAELGPVLRDLPGLRAYYDAPVAADAFVSVTVWDTQADCARGLQQLGPWVAQHLGPVLAGPPQREAGEVVSQGES